MYSHELGRFSGSPVEPDKSFFGGKGSALSFLAGNGFAIPRTLCITSQGYEYFLSRTGLRERILLELSRKDFNDMRWEEVWDASLRLRNMFLAESLPDDLHAFLRDVLAAWCGKEPMVVRSAATDEDTSRSSFAGLHESYVNVQGVESIIKHVKLVWSSLWSDAALLYRQEIGLDAGRSDLTILSDEELAGEIRRRKALENEWNTFYWEE
jgi:pyruvate,water dikinase